MKVDKAYFRIMYDSWDKKFVRWPHSSYGTQRGYHPDEITKEWKHKLEERDNTLKKYSKGKKDIDFGLVFIKVIGVFYDYPDQFRKLRKKELSQQVKYSREYVWKTTYNVFSFDNGQIVETQHVQNYSIPMEIVGFDNEQAKSYMQLVVTDDIEIVSVEVVCK